MVYLPSYVHLLSVTDTAYSDLYATNNDQRNQTNLLEIQEDEVMLQREDDHNNKNNKSMIPHGRRVLMVGGTMASSMKANDVFTLEVMPTFCLYVCLLSISRSLFAFHDAS